MKGKMVKNILVFVFAMIILSAIVGSAAAAGDLLIGREFTVEGVGVINADLEVSTEKSFNGIQLSESVSTPGGGFVRPSEIQYNSVVDVGIYNITGNTSAEVEYSSTLHMLNIKRNVYIQNYELGAVMGIKTRGSTDQEASFYSEDSAMSAEVSGDVSGEVKLSGEVKDVSDKHTVLVRDEINLKGDYNFSWEMFAESDVYPASGEGNDWLKCP